MDRVAQLAEIAREELKFEEAWASRGYGSENALSDIQAVLALHARRLGFPENEISAAIDTALGGR